MNLLMGTWKKQDINFHLTQEGGCLISGKSKRGKTCILKILLVPASKQRQIIIFSYSNEYNDIIYANTYSLNSDNMDYENTEIIGEIKIKPSELNEEDYWTSLGLPEGAATYLVSLAESVHVHHDIPEQFFNQVRNAKTSVKYTQDDNVVHEQSLISILKSETKLNKYLSSESIDWVEKLKSGKNIIINLNLAKAEKRAARFLVGFVLRKLKPYIHITKPIIGFEEVDILCPRDEPCLSRTEIIDYNLKMKKAGIFMFYVVQESYRLPRDIADNTDKFIYGQQSMDDSGFLSKLVNSIKWEHHKNYREFVYKDEDYNFISKFVPVDVPCATVIR